jgi:hypothetical protein
VRSGRCLCGDTACPSCGPAQGAPSCEYSRYRCGDPHCECASSPTHVDPLIEEVEDTACDHCKGLFFHWELKLVDSKTGQVVRFAAGDQLWCERCIEEAGGE